MMRKRGLFTPYLGRKGGSDDPQKGSIYPPFRDRPPVFTGLRVASFLILSLTFFRSCVLGAPAGARERAKRASHLTTYSPKDGSDEEATRHSPLAADSPDHDNTEDGNTSVTTDDSHIGLDVQPRRCPWCGARPRVDAGHVKYDHHPGCRTPKKSRAR